MLAKAAIVPLVCLASFTPTLAPERDLEDRLVHILELHARQARGVAASIEVGEEFTFNHAEGRIHFADNQPASVEPSCSSSSPASQPCGWSRRDT